MANYICSGSAGANDCGCNCGCNSNNNGSVGGVNDSNCGCNQGNCGCNQGNCGCSGENGFFGIPCQDFLIIGAIFLLVLTLFGET